RGWGTEMRALVGLATPLLHTAGQRRFACDPTKPLRFLAGRLAPCCNLPVYSRRVSIGGLKAPDSTRCHEPVAAALGRGAAGRKLNAEPARPASARGSRSTRRARAGLA